MSTSLKHSNKSEEKENCADCMFKVEMKRLHLNISFILTTWFHSPGLHTLVLPSSAYTPSYKRAVLVMRRLLAPNEPHSPFSPRFLFDVLQIPLCLPFLLLRKSQGTEAKPRHGLGKSATT